jgi:FtsZ-interacting cell division protein YlmF
MDKKEKQLVKALKLAGIDKEKFDQVIDLFQEDEEEKVETKEPQQEEPKEVKEEPKVEEVKKVEKKVEEPKDDTKEIITKLLEKITALEEKVEKTQSFGYSAQPSQPSSEDVDDIIAKVRNLR